MNFLKKNNYKGEEVPPLPARYGGIEAHKDVLESIDPCVCPLDLPSLLIHHLVEEPFLRWLSPVPSVGTYVGDDPVGIKHGPEVMSVKSRVKVTEKSINGYVSFLKLLCDLVHPLLYLIEIRMVSCLRPGHGQRETLIVSEEKRIGGLSFLTSLVFNTFTAPQRRSVGTVYMGKRQIDGLLVAAQDVGVRFPPLILLTPFPVVLEHGVPGRRIPAEKVTQWEKAPLASALELVEDGVDDLQKVEFRGEPSFCNRKIGHNPNFYCIFVEYGVFWHWYGILKCGNYNIVRTLLSAPYFIFFIADLTYRNKSKQLH